MIHKLTKSQSSEQVKREIPRTLEYDKENRNNFFHQKQNQVCISKLEEGKGRARGKQYHPTISNKVRYNFIWESGDI